MLIIVLSRVFIISLSSDIIFWHMHKLFWVVLLVLHARSWRVSHRELINPYYLV